MTIVHEIAAQFGVSVDEILGPRRYPILIAARRAAAQRLQEERGMGPSKIGRVLKRHHTTMSHTLGRKGNDAAARTAAGARGD